MSSASSASLARRNAIKLGAGLVSSVITQEYSSRLCSAAPMSWDEYSRLDGVQMAELVRDKALAMESQRQQWKRARMRDTGEAKTW